MSEVPGRLYFSRLSKDTGFKSDVLEKVYRLMVMIDRLNSMTELSGKLALKGGTAIQGLIFGFKRLSVDIDLNYVGSTDRHIMKQDRDLIRKFVLLLFKDLGYAADTPVGTYAEERFDAHYKNFGGGSDHLKLEINYLERMPITALVKKRLSHPFQELETGKVMTYSNEELFAGRLRALTVRSTPRDMFDAHLLSHAAVEMNESLLRKTTLFYLAMYGDARTMRPDAVRAVSVNDMKNNLMPMLSRGSRIDMDAIRGDALAMVENVLLLSKEEVEFFELMYTEKRLEPSLLFDGLLVNGDIADHPSIVWRLQNLSDRR